MDKHRAILFTNRKSLTPFHEDLPSVRRGHNISRPTLKHCHVYNKPKEFFTYFNLYISSTIPTHQHRIRNIQQQYHEASSIVKSMIQKTVSIDSKPEVQAPTTTTFFP